jgi:hypothetical protein
MWRVPLRRIDPAWAAWAVPPTRRRSGRRTTGRRVALGWRSSPIRAGRDQRARAALARGTRLHLGERSSGSTAAAPSRPIRSHLGVRRLVSTAPLPELLPMAGPAAAVTVAAEQHAASPSTLQRRPGRPAAPGTLVVLPGRVSLLSRGSRRMSPVDGAARMPCPLGQATLPFGTRAVRERWGDPPGPERAGLLERGEPAVVDWCTSRTPLSTTAAGRGSPGFCASSESGVRPRPLQPGNTGRWRRIPEAGGWRPPTSSRAIMR